MEVKAQVKHLRMSPRKVRLVVNVIRGRAVQEALAQLKFINKQAAEPVAKLIKSAVANAEHNFELDQNNLYISKIIVDEGTTLHRWLPRAHGRATPIRKKNCHIRLVLAEIKPSGKAKAKKQAITAPVKLADELKKDNQVKIKEIKQSDKAGGAIAKERVEEKGKVITDIRREGRAGHAKIEGGDKGFVRKIFRRKSG
ncbi:50S ribosomal protein L22 [Candidatus Falkowbacteria bacterium CG_4_9_14_3_um_filter_38_19]|uniref:Large ribosomal subunit protein uL22 n=2 Tax=Candidatus Falkowiibacteriota TaxID=1752728 RepID=A0A2M6WPS6_9BACT|nr:50S ribosomal protein L22 [Candidatus Falkowbacteria bacterium]PIT94807.1 MAG: 50S ribosomal protein L22 [Candidatus Falkowbacteria bacterium CG10_big_fil_rev_8_21_14_0_10_38_22]PJB17429.1 MAG: 50S ribosomal protein L22 [Candidatus Falkowbacteria bacterium CG_4_9_14_3_um_filter_38_19]